MAMEEVGIEEDMGSEGNIQCPNHPLKNNIQPGGICAFCLQEKLGKLVSSSLSTAIFPSSSSSHTPPSFRSDLGSSTAAITLAISSSSSSSKLTTNPQIKTPTQINNPQIINNPQMNNNVGVGQYHNQYYYSRKAKFPFILAQKKKKKKDSSTAGATPGAVTAVAFRRSKSTAIPNRTADFSDPDRRRRFWSFLHLKNHSNVRKTDKPVRESIGGTTTTAHGCFAQRSRENENDESPNVNRKVSRSRSVGCGSRSFSGDILERISTGLGDCTLRRVESQREGKPRASAGGRQDCMKERVKCGGIFGGFTMNSSSSSSSSSSHWVSSSAEENVNGGKTPAPVPGTANLGLGRSSRGSWGWAFASPMRAFAKNSSSVGKTEADSNKNNNNTTPNLAAIPSLLAVSS